MLEDNGGELEQKVLNVKRRVIINLNGHTYSLESPIRLWGNNDLTVNGNGTLTSSDGVNVFETMSTHIGTLRLEDGNIITGGSVVKCDFAANSKILVEDGTFNATGTSTAFSIQTGYMGMNRRKNNVGWYWNISTRWFNIQDSGRFYYYTGSLNRLQHDLRQRSRYDINSWLEYTG